MAQRNIINSMRLPGFKHNPNLNNHVSDDVNEIYEEIQDNHSPEPPPIPPRKNKVNVIPIPARNIISKHPSISRTKSDEPPTTPKLGVCRTYSADPPTSQRGVQRRPNTPNSLPITPINTGSPIRRRSPVGNLLSPESALKFATPVGQRKLSNSNSGSTLPYSQNTERINFMENLNAKLTQMGISEKDVNSSPPYQSPSPRTRGSEYTASKDDRPPQPPPRPAPTFEPLDDGAMYLTSDQIHMPTEIDRRIFEAKKNMNRINYENHKFAPRKKP